MRLTARDPGSPKRRRDGQAHDLDRPGAQVFLLHPESTRHLSLWVDPASYGSIALRLLHTLHPIRTEHRATFTRRLLERSTDGFV